MVYNPSTLEEIKKNFDLAITNPQKFKIKEEISPGTPPILIFHCEFSQQRGPRVLRTLRNLDRKLNMDRYPGLFYPYIYVLEGGYHKFHSEFPVSFQLVNLN